MPYSPPTYDPFGPLIAALRVHLPADDYSMDVENTGGGVMCLFVRDALAPLYPAPDRCVVFSDLGLDEPDPTAGADTFMGLYADWNDPDDVDNVRMLDVRYTTANLPGIAAWAAPTIRDWLG